MTSPAEQAKNLGLKYVGFGRYEDPKTQQVTYIVQNDRLVPFNKAVKTNSYVQQSGDDFGKLSKELNSGLQDTITKMMTAYKPEKYDDDELEALKQYTDTSYEAVNAVLSSLPPGIPAYKIQPLTPTDNTPDIIQALDRALDKSKLPVPIITYVPLQSGLDLRKAKSIGFKSFRSTTLSLQTALDELGQGSGGGTVLQISMDKGSKGMYVDDFSSTPGKGEFLLPRGSQIKIVDGPNKLVGTYQTADNMLEVYFYNCELS